MTAAAKTGKDVIYLSHSHCRERFDLRPQSGALHCDLDEGHGSDWHRNEAAGYEWSGRDLWPLPQSETRRVTQAA
jgi:hypothetical protein